MMRFVLVVVGTTIVLSAILIAAGGLGTGEAALIALLAIAVAVIDTQQ